MNYEVIWTPEAERDLMTVWMAAPDQLAVTRASHRIERALRRSPLTEGESRNSSVNRVVWEVPLGVLIEVIEDDKRVYVYAVWLIG